MSELKTLFIDGGYFEYTTYGSPSGQSYISLVNGVLPEKVCIPAFIDNIPVYNIDFSAFGKNEKVKEIVFEEGIKEIKAYAFYQCNQLKKIVFPESLKTLEPTVLAWCNKLEEVHLANAEFISDNYDIDNDKFVLFECPSLRTITVSPTNKHYTVKQRILLKGNSLVRYCPSPKNHVCIIPKDVDYVEIGAFHNVEPTKVKIFAEYLNGDSIENIVLDGLSRPEIFCKPKTITWTSAESLGFNPNMISSKLTMFLQNEKDGGDCNVK